MKETSFIENSSAVTDVLKQISFLKKFEDSHLANIFRMSRLRHYDAGDTIIPEGACDTFLYMLLTGEVKIIKQGSVLAWLRLPGSIFGELAVIDYQPRSASVLALTKTICLAVDSAFLDSLPPGDQAVIYAIIYRSLAEVVTERLRATSAELAALKEAVTADRRGKL